MRKRKKGSLFDFIGACIFGVVLALFFIFALTQQPDGYYTENPDKTSGIYYIWIDG